MKKLLLIFLLIATVASCSKEQLPHCGTVISKHRESDKLIVKVDYSGSVERVEVDLYQFGPITAGDQYCK